jgi:hypothetical protein
MNDSICAELILPRQLQTPYNDQYPSSPTRLLVTALNNMDSVESIFHKANSTPRKGNTFRANLHISSKNETLCRFSVDSKTLNSMNERLVATAFEESGYRATDISDFSYGKNFEYYYGNNVTNGMLECLEKNCKYKKKNSVSFPNVFIHYYLPITGFIEQTPREVFDMTLERETNIWRRKSSPLNPYTHMGVPVSMMNVFHPDGLRVVASSLFSTVSIGNNNIRPIVCQYEFLFDPKKKLCGFSIFAGVCEIDYMNNLETPNYVTKFRVDYRLRTGSSTNRKVWNTMGIFKGTSTKDVFSLVHHKFETLVQVMEMKFIPLTWVGKPEMQVFVYEQSDVNTSETVCYQVKRILPSVRNQITKQFERCFPGKRNVVKREKRSDKRKKKNLASIKRKKWNNK